MQRRRWIRALTAAALVVGLGGAACGDDDGSKTDPTTGPGATGVDTPVGESPDATGVDDAGTGGPAASNAEPGGNVPP
jgi:hypothetical protein